MHRSIYKKMPRTLLEAFPGAYPEAVTIYTRRWWRRWTEDILALTLVAAVLFVVVKAIIFFVG